MAEEKTVNESSEKRANVRFNEEEYERLVSDACVTGKSIPVLLKDEYFKGPRTVPLMGSEDQRATLAELRRIGNNINQIARHLNAGFGDSCIIEFSEIRDTLYNLRRFVGGFLGDH